VNLTSVQVLKPEGADEGGGRDDGGRDDGGRSRAILTKGKEEDDKESATGTVSSGFCDIARDAFRGCTKLKEVPVSCSYEIYIGSGAFADSGVERLLINNLGSLNSGTSGGLLKDSTLKQVFIGQLNERGSSIAADTFQGAKGEVNVYFFYYTCEEIAAIFNGNMGWYENADENVHFYFKDTMPSDVELPEGAELPGEGGDDGGRDDGGRDDGGRDDGGR
jgi:hypothetical protein